MLRRESIDPRTTAQSNMQRLRDEGGRAADETLAFGRACVTKALQRMHRRTPAGQTVERIFHQWVGSGGFRTYVAEIVQPVVDACVATHGRPASSWTKAEKTAFYRQLQQYFRELRTGISRGRGRPRKRRGIIEGPMAEGERQRKEETGARLRQIKRELPHKVNEYRLQKFAGQGSPATAETLRAYGQKNPKILTKMASEAEAVRGVLRGTGFEDYERALRQHLHRRRKRQRP